MLEQPKATLILEDLPRSRVHPHCPKSVLPALLQQHLQIRGLADGSRFPWNRKIQMSGSKAVCREVNLVMMKERNWAREEAFWPRKSLPGVTKEEFLLQDNVLLAKAKAALPLRLLALEEEVTETSVVLTGRDRQRSRAKVVSVCAAKAAQCLTVVEVSGAEEMARAQADWAPDGEERHRRGKWRQARTLKSIAQDETKVRRQTTSQCGA